LGAQSLLCLVSVCSRATIGSVVAEWRNCLSDTQSCNLCPSVVVSRLRSALESTLNTADTRLQSLIELLSTVERIVDCSTLQALTEKERDRALLAGLIELRMFLSDQENPEDSTTVIDVSELAKRLNLIVRLIEQVSSLPSPSCMMPIINCTQRQVSPAMADLGHVFYASPENPHHFSPCTTLASIETVVSICRLLRVACK
jgi:hypothetical protein